MNISQQTSADHDDAVSISSAAAITGVEIHTLRYWETEFADFLKPIRTGGGQRRYRPQDIQVVFSIKRLLRDEMYSIAGARRLLSMQQQVAA
jgi:DNA-binding transcriptional MerR regulator